MVYFSFGAGSWAPQGCTNKMLISSHSGISALACGTRLLKYVRQPAGERQSTQSTQSTHSAQSEFTKRLACKLNLGEEEEESVRVCERQNCLSQLNPSGSTKKQPQYTRTLTASWH